MFSQKGFRRFIVYQTSNRCHKSFKKPDGSDVHHSNHLADFKTMNQRTVIACVVVVLLAFVSVDAVARRTLLNTLTIKTNKRFVINECIFLC